jgi:hypothetical protein
MPKCAIRWVDNDGQQTSDNNDAVGYVYREAHTLEVGGSMLEYERSKDYPVCEHHLKRLEDPGMQYWHFVSYVEDEITKAMHCNCGEQCTGNGDCSK